MRTSPAAEDALTPRGDTDRRCRVPRLWLLVALVGSASAAGLLACCGARTDVSAAPGLVADADWPLRITAGLEHLAAGTSAVLDDDRENLSLLGKPEHRGKPQALTRVVRSAACGLGIVLELEHGRTAEALPPPWDETHLAFVSFLPSARQSERVQPTQTELPDQITLNDVRAGVSWHLYKPTSQPPRGLVVHLGGNKYVRRALLKHGWAVLSSSGTGRYFQRRASPQTFEVERGEGLRELGARLATTLDDELADWPYSLEAVLEYLNEHRPDIPQKPMAVMGFSIGAIGLPPVVARMPKRFQAAVIVAGGANLLEIARRSSKPDRGIELNWIGSEPTHDDWQQLSAAYLDQARLDPYHTAAALSGMPVLMFHAHYDQVVAAALGNLLHARLGRPRRVVYPVGHRHLLRIVMRLEAERIVEWTEQAVGGDGP